MDLKESNIKLGLIDLFSVLLPGMLFLYFVLKVFNSDLHVEKNFEELTKTEARQVFAFLIASYIAGHLMFAIGSKLDTLYDRIFRKNFEKKTLDLAYLVADRLKRQALNEAEEKKLIVERMKKTNVLNFLRRLERSRKSALRKNKVEKFQWMEDSELGKIMSWKTQVRNSDDWRKTEVKSELIKEIVESSAGEIMNTFKWSRHYLKLNYPALFNEVEAYEAQSKFFRSLLVVFMAMLIVLVVQNIRGVYPLHSLWVWYATGIVFSVACFWRYASLRFKSTQFAYEALIVLSHKPSFENNQEAEEKKPGEKKKIEERKK